MRIMVVQHVDTGRCMNEFMCRLLFVMQEEFNMSVFLASQGGGRSNYEGRGGNVIWLICEMCGKVSHRNRVVMYGNGSDFCPACKRAVKVN